MAKPYRHLTTTLIYNPKSKGRVEVRTRVRIESIQFSRKSLDLRLLFNGIKRSNLSLN